MCVEISKRCSLGTTPFQTIEKATTSSTSPKKIKALVWIFAKAAALCG